MTKLTFMHKSVVKRQNFINENKIKSSCLLGSFFCLWKFDIILAMNPLNKPLKTILSKYFFSFWRTNHYKFPKSLEQSILTNVKRFLECGDPKVGYTSFICLQCREIHKTPFSCKSRFCSSCGKFMLKIGLIRYLKI